MIVASKAKSLFEDKNIETLSEKDKVGLYYILSYIYFNIPEHLEDARARDFARMIEGDLKRLLEYLFVSYKVAYASWLHFHMVNPFYLASNILYASTFNKEYKLSYKVEQPADVCILIDYTSPSMSLKNFRYDWDTPRGNAAFATFNDRVHQWGEFMENKLRPIVERDHLLARAALAVSLHLSPEPTENKLDWMRTAENDALFADVHGAYNYMSFDSFHALEITPLALVKHSYDEYLRNDKWKSKDLGWQIASVNLLINTQHHSAKMGTTITVGDGQTEDDFLSDYMLTKLSNMDWLPKVSDLARGTEKFVALKNLYYDWQRYLPWNR